MEAAARILGPAMAASSALLWTVMSACGGTPAAPPALVIPPVPEIPGEHPMPDEEEEALERARRDEAEYQERLAAAAASPRRSIFAPHRGVQQGPAVPAAPVRRRQQVNLVPAESGVADRNAMSESLRIMPFEMRQPSGFTTLYKVDARPDVLVRGNGAVYAVFPQGDYAISVVQKRRVVQTLVPAGTTYYIGEPDWRTVWLPGIRGMMPRLRRETPEEYAARTPPATSRERIEPTMPVDFDGVYLRAVFAEEITGLGPISHRIDTLIQPSDRAFDPPPPAVPLRRGPAPERPEQAAPGGPVDAAPDPRVEPPLHADQGYRRQRLRHLLESAAKQSPPS